MNCKDCKFWTGRENVKCDGEHWGTCNIPNLGKKLIFISRKNLTLYTESKFYCSQWEFTPI